MKNRITIGIERAEAAIASKGHSPEKLVELAKSLDMDLGEFARFQELKSVAVARGVLTLEEAQTIYALLGHIPEHFNKQPLAVKWVLSEVFASLLKR